MSFAQDKTAPFFWFIIGEVAALVFLCMRTSYGRAKSCVGGASMGVMRLELMRKSIVPVVMTGVLGIYGLILAVIIRTGINPQAKPYYVFDWYAHLASGLAYGLAGLSAGMAFGIFGNTGVRATSQQPKVDVHAGVGANTEQPKLYIDGGVQANAEQPKQQPKLSFEMIRIFIFAEALALEGLMLGIILAFHAGHYVGKIHILICAEALALDCLILGIILSRAGQSLG